MLSTGLLISAGATIVIAFADEILENTGFQWVGTVLRIAIPLTALVFGVYFLEHNPILRWIR